MDAVIHFVESKRFIAPSCVLFILILILLIRISSIECETFNRILFYLSFLSTYATDAILLHIFIDICILYNIRHISLHKPKI